MKDPDSQLSIVRDISFLSFLGIKVVLVHGGGYLIDEWLTRLNIKPLFHNGLRVTDIKTMEVVEMVLSGIINKNLVSSLNDNYASAVGLSGKDGNLVKAKPMFNNAENCTGKIVEVNAKILLTLLNNRFIPVIASVACDSIGNTYNINADTLAASIASSLEAEKLLMLTDMPGILQDTNDISSLIKELNLDQISDLKSKSIIRDGMIPKIDSAVYALKNRVKSVHIIDGKLEHCILNEVLTNNKVGSTLVL